MAKKLKLDETGDSDDLQALFDSIASGPAKSEFKVVADPGGSSGDDDELQSLFDAVAAQFDAAASCESSVEKIHSSSALPEHSCDAVFTRIGQMTRQVHNTLRGLGSDGLLQDAVQAIPDARERLSYIAQMTEQAASRVLNATDIAQPIQNRMHADARNLEAQWDRLFANELSVDEFKALSGSTRDFLGEVVRSSRATNEQLMEIMMAQDFQDLTGQVIKKVVDLAQKLETELLQVLLEVTPPQMRGDRHGNLLNGPVISSAGRDDVVTTQEQVDDLLDSLGF
ncbi:protein phosphatase CheZ [Aromatoleum buckelii]|uniref:Protein phosphatase CheZ n=1 Tax=Aromatoleum buckelii TaxID=200254 RepID=A0ABX1N0E3_9RHOO|nr:protein phosphatase CheZ [Aromatoleum buckelii]MCK0511025.1 protein phosphatase CheZ [Aromatoleum buckelii]